MRTITCGDLHGSSAWKTIAPDKYDLIVFVGDFLDHWTRTDKEILDNFKAVIDFKKKHGSKVVLLYSNHDLAYVFQGSRVWECPGFRGSMAAEVKILYQENHELFQAAHQVKNYLWTHAGITREWYDSVLAPLESSFVSRFSEFSGENLATRLNAMMQTSYADALSDRGYYRGGSKKYGGLFWADYNEHYKGVGLKGYHQITGHNIVKNIHTLYWKDKEWTGNNENPTMLPLQGNSTTVTFTDCLDTKNDFYEVEI